MEKEENLPELKYQQKRTSFPQTERLVRRGKFCESVFLQKFISLDSGFNRSRFVPNDEHK